jgi:methionyl-tRNA formyltransferase
VRAYSPWPGSTTTWQGRLLKIIAARASSCAPEQSTQPTGTVLLGKERGQHNLLVVTGDGCLLIERLQLEGKKAMSADEFLRGYPQIVGARLE